MNTTKFLKEDVVQEEFSIKTMYYDKFYNLLKLLLLNCDLDLELSEDTKQFLFDGINDIGDTPLHYLVRFFDYQNYITDFCFSITRLESSEIFIRLLFFKNKKDETILDVFQTVSNISCNKETERLYKYLCALERHYVSQSLFQKLTSKDSCKVVNEGEYNYLNNQRQSRLIQELKLKNKVFKVNGSGDESINELNSVYSKKEVLFLLMSAGVICGFSAFLSLCAVNNLIKYKNFNCFYSVDLTTSSQFAVFISINMVFAIILGFVFYQVCQNNNDKVEMCKEEDFHKCLNLDFDHVDMLENGNLELI